MPDAPARTPDCEFVLAALQAAAISCDVEASTANACALIEQAGQNGAHLAAFGEAWIGQMNDLNPVNVLSNRSELLAGPLLVRRDP
jgi:predicted amidohydrolase